jgi:multidrug efflux pump subunit AcrA (membrane-fusion protein)
MTTRTKMTELRSVKTSWLRQARHFALCCAALASALALAGCGGSAENAGKMTSFSTTESAASKAELFSLPPDQMSHITLYTVAEAPLVRTLRLSGTVTYNAFLTTPVITQVSGPVSRILAMPGDHVRAGQPLLYIASPDYSQLRSAYLKARDAFQLSDFTSARRICWRIRPSRRPTWNRRNRTATRRRRTCSPANRPFAFWASRTQKASRPILPPRNCRCWRRWLEK